MAIPAAVGIAAEIGGSLLGGLFGSSSAKRAARQREQAYRAAMEETGRGYEQAQEFLDPRLQQEGMAMERVNALLGLSGEAPDFDVFRSTPGYQFQLDQGQQAIERSAAARGGLQSGNTLAAVTQFGQGLADQTFNNYLAQVMGLSQQGADMASAGLATDRSNRLADLELGRGGVRASGTEQSANQWLNALGGVANTVGSVFGGNALAQSSAPSGGLSEVRVNPRYTNRYR